jgi:hypothetical protein
MMKRGKSLTIKLADESLVFGVLVLAIKLKPQMLASLEYEANQFKIHAGDYASQVLESHIAGLRMRRFAAPSDAEKTGYKKALKKILNERL